MNHDGSIWLRTPVNPKAFDDDTGFVFEYIIDWENITSYDIGMKPGIVI